MKLVVPECLRQNHLSPNWTRKRNINTSPYFTFPGTIALQRGTHPVPSQGRRKNQLSDYTGLWAHLSANNIICYRIPVGMEVLTDSQKYMYRN